jgi:hypothetical protein
MSAPTPITHNAMAKPSLLLRTTEIDAFADRIGRRRTGVRPSIKDA